MSTNATKNVAVRYDKTGKEFHRLHASGAARYGAAWLHANQAAAEFALSRVELSDPAAKELISLVVLRVLYRLHANGHLKDYTREQMEGWAAKEAVSAS